MGAQLRHLGADRSVLLIAVLPQLLHQGEVLPELPRKKSEHVFIFNFREHVGKNSNLLFEVQLGHEFAGGAQPL